MEIRKEKVKYKFILITASLFITVSFYVVCGVNSDDAGTYTWLREHFELGGVHHTLREFLNPWWMVAVILYKLQIWSTGSDLLAYCYCVWIFLCSYLTLKIALKKNVIEERKNAWLPFLAVFIMMPAVSNKYHLPVIFAALLLLWAIEQFVSERNWILFVLSLFYVLYTIIFSNDRILMLMEITAPAVLYAIIWCMQKKERQKYLLVAVGFVTFILAGIRVITDICSCSITGSWGGYGGEQYMYWTDMHTFFDKGIPSFFAALLNNYNIDINGGLIQFMSFYWIIKIFIVGIMLMAFVSRSKQIIVKGIENVDIIDSLSVLTSIALVGVNLLNGIAKAFTVQNQPINRYAGLVWYLLIILLIRWINEYYISFDLVKIKKRNVSSGFLMGMILIFLIIGYSQPVYKGREVLTSEPCQAQLDFLQKYGDEYRFGVASYWKTNPITAISNGKYVLCTGWVAANPAKEGKLCLEGRSNLCDYKDGSNFFNFIISDQDNFMTLEEENINAVRGDYIDKIETEDAIYYMYDYDIRWDANLIMEAVGDDYELTDPIQYYFDFPIGENRIEMEVANSANLELAIEDNEDVKNVSVQKISDNKVYVDLVCTQNTKVTFHVARRLDEFTTIHKIVLKRIKAAIGIETDELYLKPGSYVVTFDGSNLHDLQISFLGDNLRVLRLTDGSIKNRYQIDVNKTQTIKYSAIGKNVSIDSVYYENTVLFEDQ